MLKLDHRKYMKEDASMKDQITYKLLNNDHLDLLVQLRIKDLNMYSNKKISQETIENIKNFYSRKIENGECHTLVGCHLNKIVATATIYYYHILPSNENTMGKVGQITNVWVEKSYRHQGIGRYMIHYLISHYQRDVGMICLNSSNEGVEMYKKMGFNKKDNYLVYYPNNV